MPGSECAVFLNFDVDFGTGLPGYQNRLVYVPARNGVVATDTWQEWNALAPGALWNWSRFARGPDNTLGTSDDNTWPDGDTNEYRTWADIVASFPNGHVNENLGSSQLLFRAGEPYPNGFIGNLDEVTFGIDGTSTVFDFEPTPAGPPNLAPNPDFEADPSTSYFTHGAATFSWATDQSHSPTHSLKIVSTSGGLKRWLSKTNAIAATPGTQYTACVYLKTQGVGTNAAQLAVNFWNASQTYIPATVGSPTLSGTTDWTQVCVTATSPAGTAYIRVEFRLTGPGTLWADDVSVTTP
jgi:hypothetical protein